jgi:hypothetical protein
MADPDKKTKRALRELMAVAHEEELRQALGTLAGHFDRWRQGEIDSFELSRLIHEFHDGEDRELWTRYDPRNADIAVARAIDRGIVDRSTVPPEVLEHLSRLLAFLAE